MMPKLLLFPFLIISTWVGAQNLVPDPGFEIHNDPCTDNWPGLTHWFNPNTATPDLWSMQSCGNNIVELQAQGVLCPTPYEGLAYSGLFTSTTESTVNHTREYLYCQLTEDLTSGADYTVSFVAYRNLYYSWSIDKLGIAFTDFSPWFDTFQVIPIEPQLETSGILIQPDSSYWQNFQFNYTASGGERYLIIGNFRYPNEMLMFNTLSGKGNTRSYHFFDMISVVENITTSTQINIPLEMFNAWFSLGSLHISNMESLSFTLYDLLGRELKKGIVDTGVHSIPVSCDKGIYLLNLSANGNSRTIKLWKE